MIKTKRHPACELAVGVSWVELGEDVAYRFVMEKDLEGILDSDFYKNGVWKYWLPIKKVDVKSQDNPNDKEPIAAYEVEHIKHVTRFRELTPRQFIDSVILLCDYLLYCIPYGLSPSHHIWNVSHYKGKPIYIDTGDFVGPGLASFAPLTYFLDPESPYSTCHLLENVDNIRNDIEVSFGLSLKRINKIYIRNENLELVGSIKKAYEKAVPKKQPLSVSRWRDYDKNKFDYGSECVLGIREKYGEKGRVVFDTIEKRRPKTLFDAGCNNGIYSFVAEWFGAKTVGVDACHDIVDYANEITRVNELNCTFVSYDIMGYNEAEGGGGAYGRPTDRYKCEALVAPALIHHLSVQGHDIESVIKRLTEYAYGWMLVEWVPDYGTTLNEVVDAAIRCGWGKITVMDSAPKGRKWILCE